MILAVDIGNTSISVGVGNGAELCYSAKLAAERGRSADEYAVLMNGVFRMHGLDPASLDGAILLSVVPQLTHTILSALSLFGIRPTVVGAGIRTGLNIRVETPGLLGADIVAGTVAALRLAEPPLAVVDLGTATTLTVINENRELCGCVIAPGVKLSADALSASCALLPEISLTKPVSLLGRNTADSMNSGAVLGAALMIDGFLDRIREEYGFGDRLNVLASGGLAGLIVPLCRNRILCAPDLTLSGLFRLYELNRRTPGQDR